MRRTPWASQLGKSAGSVWAGISMLRASRGVRLRLELKLNLGEHRVLDCGAELVQCVADQTGDHGGKGDDRCDSQLDFSAGTDVREGQRAGACVVGDRSPHRLDEGVCVADSRSDVELMIR